MPDTKQKPAPAAGAEGELKPETYELIGRAAVGLLKLFLSPKADPTPDKATATPPARPPKPAP